MAKEGGDVLLLGETVSAGIDQDHRSILLEGVEFEVGKEVADLFLSAHAQRDEPISPAPSTTDERELHDVSIQYQSA